MLDEGAEAVRLMLVPHLPHDASRGSDTQEFPRNEWNKSIVPAIDGWTVVGSVMRGNVRCVITITIDFDWSHSDNESGAC